MVEMKTSELFQKINKILMFHNSNDAEILKICEDRIELFVDGVLEVIELEKIYYDKRLKESKILKNERYKDYEYYIITLGTHPCSYVVLPKDHKYYGMNYDEIDVKCHYGLTYSRDYLISKDLIEDDVWIIGWDYAHLGDYIPYEFSDYGHKYTLDELVKEVEDVIDQL